jgi:thioredoxin reductase (NADPH)
MVRDGADIDVVVVGAGAAGLSAALMLARARRRVVCVDAGSPRNANAAHVHGFLSRDETSPAELLALGGEDVARYGGKQVSAVVSKIAHDPQGGFVVEAERGSRWSARAVVVATGLRDELPPIPGVHERWGGTVLHCPYCHGYEVSDEPLVVVGGENRPFTMHQVQLVRQWSSQVTFALNGIVLDDQERERLTARGIELLDESVRAVVSQYGAPVALEFADGRVVPYWAVFVGPRFVPRDELLRDLGCPLDETGAVAVDATGQTGIAGAWAVGNVVRDTQAIVSAASGATAGIAVNHYLLADDIDRAVTNHRAGSEPREPAS